MRTRHLAWVLLLGACACGHQEPDEKGPPASKLPSFDIDPNSLEGQPGLTLTLEIVSASDRPAGAFLSKDDALYGAFHESAEARRRVLTFHGRPLADRLTGTGDAAALWTRALERLRVTRARPRADGKFDVVIQADLKDVFLHLSKS